MAVPEQNHLLLKRPRPRRHAIEPPAAQFDDLLRLRALLGLLRQSLGFRRQALHGANAFRAAQVGNRPDRIGRGIGNFFVIKQRGQRRVVAEVGQPGDFLRRAAEPGPVQQVRRRLVIPDILCQWLKHTL